MNIIIAEINIHNSYEDFYSKTRKYSNKSCEGIKKELINSSANFKANIDFYCVYDFNEMESLIQSFDKKNKILIFSNFPADNSYKRYKIINDNRHNKSYMIADAYGLTKNNYKRLLLNNSNIELHVITGASESLLPHKEVIGLNATNLISHKNKNEWDYFSMDDYQKYITDIQK